MCRQTFLILNTSYGLGGDPQDPTGEVEVITKGGKVMQGNVDPKALGRGSTIRTKAAGWSEKADFEFRAGSAPRPGFEPGTYRLTAGCNADLTNFD